MKKFLFLMLAMGLFVACQPKDNAAENVEIEKTIIVEEGATDGVFIHISHGKENAHRLLMALAMANRMAPDKDVIVYMDIDAVHAAVKGAEAISMEPFGSHLDLLQSLLDQGVEVMVCPTCLQVAGFTPEDIMEGLQVASKEKFFDFTDGRILSLDY